LKWFKFAQKHPKTAETVPSVPSVPNVYLIPDDSSLIVTPEFDFPLPSFPFPVAAFHETQSPHRNVTNNAPAYHYVLSRTVSTRSFPNHSNSSHNSTHNPVPCTTDSFSRRSASKLRKPPPHSSGRALSVRAANPRPQPDPLPTTTPSVALVSSPQNPSEEIGFPSAPVPTPLTTVNTAIHNPPQSSPPSPSASAFVPSPSSDAPLLRSRSTTSSKRNSTKKATVPARKLTKRKRQSSNASPDYAKLPNRDAPIPDTKSAQGAHQRSSQTSIRATPAVPALPANLTRFSNFSVPELYSNASPVRGSPGELSPESRARASQRSSQSTRKPVPSSSPPPGETDKRPTSGHSMSSQAGKTPQGRSRAVSETQHQVMRAEVASDVNLVSFTHFFFFGVLIGQ